MVLATRNNVALAIIDTVTYCATMSLRVRPPTNRGHGSMPDKAAAWYIGAGNDEMLVDPGISVTSEDQGRFATRPCTREVPSHLAATRI